jgi:preprotein translocase subunit SecD
MLLMTLSLGCSSREPSTTTKDPFQKGLQFHWAETAPGDGLIEKTVLGTEERLYLHEEVLLTGGDVESASAFPAVEGPAILLNFTAQGREKIARVTASSEGRRLAIMVDGVVITAPKIAEPIPGKATIFGYFSMDEAERLVRKICTAESSDR